VFDGIANHLYVVEDMNSRAKSAEEATRKNEPKSLHLWVSL